MKFMPKGSEFLKNSVIEMGPFVKVQIYVESRSQSSTPPRPPYIESQPFLEFLSELLELVSFHVLFIN